MHALQTSTSPAASSSWTRSTVASDRMLVTPGSPDVRISSALQREEYYIGTPIKMNLNVAFNNHLGIDVPVPANDFRLSIFERLYQDATARTARRADEKRRFVLAVDNDERRRTEDVLKSMRESAGKCKDIRNASLRNLDLLSKRAEWARRGNEARLRREAEEMKECTFHPKILRRKVKRIAAVDAGEQKKPVPAPFKVFRTLRRNQDAKLSGIDSMDVH